MPELMLDWDEPQELPTWSDLQTWNRWTRELLILQGLVESQLLLHPTNTDLLLLRLQTHMVSPIGFDGYQSSNVCSSFLVLQDCSARNESLQRWGRVSSITGSGVIISDWITSLVKSHGMLPPFAFWIHYCFYFRIIILLQLINCSKTELSWFSNHGIIYLPVRVDDSMTILETMAFLHFMLPCFSWQQLSCQQ